MKWNSVPLNDIADIYSGFAFKSSDMSAQGDIPLIKIKNISNFSVSQQCDTYLNPDIITAKYDRFILQENDFLIAMTGQGSVGRIGRMSRIDRCYYVNQRVAIVRVDPKKAFPPFVFHQIATPQNESILFNKANGAGQPNLSPAQIGELTVTLPPKDKQIQIANIFDNFNRLIENNQKQIKLLEEAAQRLYKEWFVNFRFPGCEDTPIVDGVPKGWKRKSLGDFKCRLETGSRPKGGIDSSIKDGIPSIGAENVIGLGQYNFSSEKFVTKEFFSMMKKGRVLDKDILIYKDGAYIGRTSLFQDGFPHVMASVNEHVFLLHMADEWMQYYIFFTLYQHEYFLKRQKLNKNAAQPGINSRAMLSLELLIPTTKWIENFHSFTSPIMGSIFSKAKQNQELIQARDRLLPKLMSGELEV